MADAVEGQSRIESIRTDIDGRWLDGERFLEVCDSELGAGGVAMLMRLPVGLIDAITPGSGPVSLAACKRALALAGGTMKRRSVIKLLGAALPGSALAQAGSGRPLRLVVPLGTGTGTDVVSRLIAPKLGELLNQTVIVENRPGASGVIGVQEVLKSPPDGNTVLMGSVSVLAINMATLKNMPYDPRRDFTHISGAYNANHVWIVNNNFAAKTFGEFVAYAKNNPGKVRAGHASALIKIQLAALEKMAGIELLDVPYKAAPTVLQDLIGGILDVTLVDTSLALPTTRQGQVRALAVSAPKRNPLSPDWPPVADTVSGYDFTSWTAMVGPPRMPADVVSRLNGAMVQVMKLPDIAAKLASSGITPWTSTPAQLTSFIDSEVAKWTRVAREAKIEVE